MPWYVHVALYAITFPIVAAIGKATYDVIKFIIKKFIK